MHALTWPQPRLRRRWHPAWAGLLMGALLWLQVLGVQHLLRPGHAPQGAGWHEGGPPAPHRLASAAHTWERVLGAALDHPLGGVECLHLDQLSQAGAPALAAAAGVVPVPVAPLPRAPCLPVVGGGAAPFDARAPPSVR